MDRVYLRYQRSNYIDLLFIVDILSGMDTESRARANNSPEFWADTWRAESHDSWRKDALRFTYDRIIQLIPRGSTVVDIGGGIGILAKQLLEIKQCKVTVWEHSREVLSMLPPGVDGRLVDLEQEFPLSDADVLIATEVVEHLSVRARSRIFDGIKNKLAFISVPNNRLGPDEEPQHTIKYTAKSFLDDIGQYNDHVRVECNGPYLLGIFGVKKNFSLSVCFPARDEQDDIERTLASFRGVADQLVVGIDPRSSDRTKEIAQLYCDVVFDLESPEGISEDKAPEGGVHFSWIRNQCIDRCTGDWVFMTEAHEHLEHGQDTLLKLDSLMPAAAQVGFTLRQGQRQQWAFPWLFKRETGFRYKRSTHNVLDYPEGTYVVRLPQVITIHDRSHNNAVNRKQQRKIQNRKTLFDDWVVNKNANSLFYLGSELREQDNKKAIERLRQYLNIPTGNGEMRYQARLILAKTLQIEGDIKGAKDVLHGCTGDDWNRIDHWIWLGDLCFEQQKFEESVRFYRYAATMMGSIPFTIWWIDLDNYSYIPAQRLAMAYSELGLYRESYYWARKVKELLPNDSPREQIDEVDNNIELLKNAVESEVDNSENRLHDMI